MTQEDTTPASTALPYNGFSSWIRRKFPYRVQKISIDAGFSCPNRDGRISSGGCSFCDNRTFNPSYCNPQRSVSQQIADGKAFFQRKYPEMKYLAYFQAFTNTYAPIDTLQRLYNETLQCQDVVGIVIGTRPDCVSDELLDWLARLSRQTYVMVEYGIESANDDTLRRINRGHDFECSRRAVCETASRGIEVGGHVILGLPGEDESESIRQAEMVSALPLDVLKIHQLQVIRGTRLAQEYARSPFPLYSVDDYIRLIGKYISHLRPTLVIERFASQSPAGMLVAPKWGLKNYELTNLIVTYLRKNGISQGMALG